MRWGSLRAECDRFSRLFPGALHTNPEEPLAEADFTPIQSLSRHFANSATSSARASLFVNWSRLLT
jgi:hypothetical protein